MKYAFIKEHRDEFSVRAMCRVLKVHVSGFYAWLKNGLSMLFKAGWNAPHIIPTLPALFEVVVSSGGH